ncbi:DUF72 domain-containing protein [Thermoflavimicrobium dichotomicum]|uniref:Uncharacterized conserved protein YecE, DUF72 family n=1 Tax=Thermoflavimicrobium dichotomicum TaxID=46223 RepID=A0A1I3LXP7_9BACL|nr:DUF72 domain-containing protein [Thermoflavimicrobium dichotomicum]SFI89483.1 Uncharacterized conserved protein YecE, DUF72 family [Thermoflavimicrobium dichotomicum]
MNRILVGVCGWGDHDLYPPGTPSRDKLAIYAGHFPVVELDSTYHAIAPPERMERWVHETPDSFRFVVKAYRELTGHGRLERAPVRSWQEIVHDMKTSLQPMKRSGKLSMVLFQFPPWYDCSARHVRYIRKVREAFRDFPVAIEFRNQSWFTPHYQEKTLHFLEQEQLIHVVCDEPQAGQGSVPIVPAVTHPDTVLVRFHGRNVDGWNNTGRPDWRDVRYAYRYSEEELDEWVPRIRELQKKANQIILLFNNNSQGDAVDSAKMMIRKLGLNFEGLAPRQLEIL